MVLARNLELKVGCGSDALTEIRARLAAVDPSLADPERMRQVDTYYRVPRARLKLRQIDRPRADGSPGKEGRSAELIGYNRPREPGSRWSTYRVAAVDPRAAGELHEALALTHDVLVRVVKRRDVVHVGATRIHLDEVDELGAFIELETVIHGQDESDARREHEAVIALLQLDRFSPIAGSYSDLLLAQSRVRKGGTPGR
jgi:adenylate cyclase class IV